MTHPTAPHPDWQALLDASDADEAMQELHDRLDREADRSPAPICPAFSPAGQRPASPAGRPHPQPVASLATGAVAGTGSSFEGGLGARTPEAA